ncbi:hypothetical protein Y032_0036g3284 [Ancylostoma ceylanicum]|uniref:Uncharacterized protein n=1 Tax=Ancylostoma ceylanicum TaxID=53326 RepID=A0A016UKE7_9BILA|nr:hypothetical protein Y032_0036g3284 [Ancylostoma ceylanicum]
MKKCKNTTPNRIRTLHLLPNKRDTCHCTTVDVFVALLSSSTKFLPTRYLRIFPYCLPFSPPFPPTLLLLSLWNLSSYLSQPCVLEPRFSQQKRREIAVTQNGEPRSS